MSKSPRSGGLVVWAACAVVMALVLPSDASAQPLGTFRWQQQPYCNVFTVTVVQVGAVYQVDGFDDQCGAGTRAAASGLAFQNPDGTIGFGLTIVTAPGGTPVHLDATIDLGSLSGTWRDSSGATGAWTFTPGGPAGGSPRPVPRAAFPAGISAGNAAIADVGTPVNGTDAATKAYVDGASAAISAADRSYARGIVTAPRTLTTTGFVTYTGSTTFEFGCAYLSPSSFTLLIYDLNVPIGAVLTAVRVRYIDFSSAALSINVNRQVYTSNSSSNVAVASLATTGIMYAPRVATIAVPAFPPASDTNVPLVQVSAPVHADSLAFCGLEPIFTWP